MRRVRSGRADGTAEPELTALPGTTKLLTSPVDPVRCARDAASRYRMPFEGGRRCPSVKQAPRQG